MLKLRRISASHRDAFLERYDGLHAWAVQMTGGDRALAEDLLHDLFILFTLSQPDLSRIVNLDNYLYASLRNLHISQLRRATRARFERLSVIEYESARMNLRSLAHGRDLIQVQDDLRRVCHYACARKETANAASVLILRFFHGYYPSEIAKILRSSRRAVDDRLRAARTEAKACLESAPSVTYIQPISEAETPEVFPAKFARRAGDFLLELQQTIFNSRQGECPTREQLKSLYESSLRESMDSKRLAHIVSCPTCLDTVNHLLDLPPLAERYPTDTMDKDNKKSGGPPQGGDAGGAHRRAIREWEREARDAFEHKPQELCVSVNGHLLGSQLIGAEWSELTLNVSTDERISFCEVFSEQGVRLMMMNVEELPPNGPGELRQQIDLSEARTLESTLLFSNPFPTLRVTYHDPALATAPVAETEDEQAQTLADAQGAAVAPEHIKPIKRLRQAVSIFVQALRAGLKPPLWFQPGTVTAVFALLLIATLVFVQLHYGPAPKASAAELLHQSAVAEEAVVARTDQVLHRTINLEEKKESGELIARHRVEVWQSAEHGITARRLYDDRGALVAGEWRRRDGVQTLYHRGSPPRSKMNAQAQPIRFDTVWQLSLSARDFTALIGDAAAARVEEQATSYVIKYAGARSRNGILNATLVLSRADIHAVEQALTLQNDTEIRKFRFVESRYERRPTDAVAPSVFEPEPELLSSIGPARRIPKSEGSRPQVPAPVVATAALEVEALRLLNQVGADLGEQVSVSRTADGELKIQGLVETDKRKAELLVALSPVAGHPAVRIEMSTVAEATAAAEKASRGNQSRASASSVVVQHLEATKDAMPAGAELRRYFAGDDEQARRFALRMIYRSHEAMRHAGALKRLMNQFSLQDLRELDPGARMKWLALVGSHAKAFQVETAALREELQPIFFAAASSGESQQSITIATIADDPELARAVARLFELGSTNDATIRAAFSSSADATAGSVRISPELRGLLESTEGLAAAIQKVQ